MLKSITVENYRSFAEPAKLTISPLTILIGRNSAGKSSLTRLFPILKRSLNRDTSSPVLWAAPGSLDFGKISDVLNHQSNKNELRLSFDLGVFDFDAISPVLRFGFITPDPRNKTQLQFTAVLQSGQNGQTRYKAAEIAVGGDVLRADFEGNFVKNFSVNSRKVDTTNLFKNAFRIGNSLFPTIYYEPLGDESVRKIPDFAHTFREFFPAETEGGADDHFPVPLRHLRSYTEISPIPFFTRQVDRTYSDAVGMTVPKSKFENFYRLLMVGYFSALVEALRGEIQPTFSNVTYLGPIRASGSRFYREQELSVDQIDEQGENLATYISSLSKRGLESFNELLDSMFGVVARSHSYPGHVSIEIGRKGSQNFDNLADVGFGYSQLLPIVAQLHSLTSNRDHRSSAIRHRIVAIEQPELHLHPAYQAQLADLFARAIAVSKDVDFNISFVLETHSEALIARLTDLVAAGSLDPEDISLNFVEKDDDSGSSSILQSKFEYDGSISNWPIGFFSARR